MNWHTNELLELQKYYEGRKAQAEFDMQDSSWPEGEELEINISDHCMCLIDDMLNEKTWIFRLCKDKNM